MNKCTYCVHIVKHIFDNISEVRDRFGSMSRFEGGGLRCKGPLCKL